MDRANVPTNTCIYRSPARCFIVIKLFDALNDKRSYSNTL